MFRPELNYIDVDSGRDSYVVEVSFDSSKEEVEAKIEETIKEEEMSEEELPEEKRQVFVDTSDKTDDELPQVETEKIGAVGSIAKDMYTGQDNINDEPRLTDDSESIVLEPEYRTALTPQQADVPVEPQTAIDPPVNEEMFHEASGGEAQQKTEEVRENAVHEEIGGKTLVQDTRVEAEDHQNPQIDDGDMKVSSFESEVNVFEPVTANEVSNEEVNLSEETDNDKKEPEQGEAVPDPEKEHIKLVSIPKEILNQIVEAPRKEIKKNIQENPTGSELQEQTYAPAENVQAPFFEDNISNAPIQGQESFNIKKHEYAPYYKHIRDKIRLFWLVQFGTDASINLVTKEYKPIIVEFKVLPSGKIVNVMITNTAGNDLLASKVQTSVQNTILDKFPEYVNENFINVKFNFYFF